MMGWAEDVAAEFRAAINRVRDDAICRAIVRGDPWFDWEEPNIVRNGDVLRAVFEDDPEFVSRTPRIRYRSLLRGWSRLMPMAFA